MERRQRELQQQTENEQDTEIYNELLRLNLKLDKEQQHQKWQQLVALQQESQQRCGTKIPLKSTMKQPADSVPGYTDFGSRVWHVYICRLLGRMDCRVPHCPRYRRELECPSKDPPQNRPSTRSKSQQNQRVRKIEAETAGPELPMEPGNDALTIMCRVLHAMVCRNPECPRKFCKLYHKCLYHVLFRHCPAAARYVERGEENRCFCVKVAAFVRHWGECRARDCAYCSPIKQARDAYLRERRLVCLPRAQLRDFQQQMLLLLHADACQGCYSKADAAENGQWPPCIVPQCWSMRIYIKHAKLCRYAPSNECPVPHCYRIKTMARHWLECTLSSPKPRCASCRLVKRTYTNWCTRLRNVKREWNFGLAMAKQRLMLLLHVLDCMKKGDERKCSVRGCKLYKGQILRHLNECLGGQQHPRNGLCGKQRCSYNSQLLQHYLSCQIETNRPCLLCDSVRRVVQDRANETSACNFQQLKSSRHKHFYLFEAERFLKQQRCGNQTVSSTR